MDSINISLSSVRSRLPNHDKLEVTRKVMRRFRKFREQMNPKLEQEHGSDERFLSEAQAIAYATAATTLSKKYRKFAFQMQEKLKENFDQHTSLMMRRFEYASRLMDIYSTCALIQ